MRYLLPVICLGSSMLLCSCSNYSHSTSFVPVEKEYARQISQLSAGMSKEQLQKLFPDIHVVYHKWTEKTYCEVLESEHIMLTNDAYVWDNQGFWFYMRDGSLVEWGNVDYGVDNQVWQKYAGHCPCKIERPVGTDDPNSGSRAAGSHD